jgi:hypothetical protein
MVTSGSVSFSKDDLLRLCWQEANINCEDFSQVELSLEMLGDNPDNFAGVRMEYEIKDAPTNRIQEAAEKGAKELRP